MLKAPNIIFSKTDTLAELPVRDSISNAGYIFKSIETKIIPDGKSILVDTGLKIEDIHKGVWATIFGLPELEEKNITTHKIIDNRFKGNLKIRLYNNSDSSYLINKGDRIAQIAYFPLLTIEPEFKNEQPLQ
jgi:dUTP pyrophosphatase